MRILPFCWRNRCVKILKLLITDAVWVYYRNYAAQHIPRHHAAECRQCNTCAKLVANFLLTSHTKLCARGDFRRRSRKRPIQLLALDQPPVCKSAEAADKSESLLICQGMTVARGALTHSVGYPTSCADVLEDNFECPTESSVDRFACSTKDSSDACQESLADGYRGTDRGSYFCEDFDMFNENDICIPTQGYDIYIEGEPSLISTEFALMSMEQNSMPMDTLVPGDLYHSLSFDVNPFQINSSFID